MRLLVAYATQHGATRGIAERIAERLHAIGHTAELQPMTVSASSDFDAYILGSSVYLGHWNREAMEFVRRYADTVSGHPVWLFSSGPLGTEPKDDKGVDKRTAAVPTDLGELNELLAPRGHRVFFGALRPEELPILPRIMRLLPAGRALLEEGDFRDWSEIDTWADEIAAALAGEPTPVR